MRFVLPYCRTVRLFADLLRWLNHLHKCWLTTDAASIVSTEEEESGASKLTLLYRQRGREKAHESFLEAAV